MRSIVTQVHNLIGRVLLRRRDDRGASLVEYALLVALIAIVCIVAVTFLGGETSQSFESNASSLFRS
ncbi:MAG: Flp family type IVb pilin [Acidimicrobiales bacterium]|nr:Flp family type IVb pilin [Acidimicrobiales bacterium]